MDQFIGEIRLFTWDWAPKGWALCAGQLLPVNQNQALFALLGVVYGGDGRTTFGLPDLRSRVPIDVSPQEAQGTKDGAEQVLLTTGTMPAHTHPLVGTSTAATVFGPLGHVFATDNTPAADFFAADSNPLLAISPNAIGQVGGNQPHNNMQPFLVLNYCIALTGIFPSRG